MKIRRLHAFTFLAVLLALVLVAGWTFESGERARRENLEIRVAELRLEAQSRTVLRAVVQGDPVPGSAWEDYSVALSDSVNWDDDRNGSVLGSFLDRNDPEERQNADKIVADHAQLLDYVQRGARRTNGQFPYEWELGPRMPLPSLLATRRIANLAAAQARIWIEEGRSREAASLLLDTAVFARDIGANGPLLPHLMGISVYSVVLDEMRTLLRSGNLSRRELADFARGLEILDRDFPGLGPVFASETLTFETAMLEATTDHRSPQEWWNLMGGDGWRYGFSSARIALEASEKGEAYFRRSASLDQMGFIAATKEAETINADAGTSGNPLLTSAMPNLSKIFTKRAETLARLRLLRAGAAMLATGSMPAVKDPLGDELFRTVEGGNLKIWSVGIDGQDQDGSGSWKDGQPDIVLEIPAAKSSLSL